MQFAGILMLIAFPVGPLALGVYAWLKLRQQEVAPAQPEPVAWWPGVLNASLCFALAFNLVYFVQEFFLAWPKALLPGVEAVVYHNNHGWRGDHPDVLIYQGAGAVAIAVMAALLIALGLALGRRLKGWAPMLWWTVALASGLGLVQFVIAAMHPDNDVGQAFDALQLSPLSRNLIAAICAAGLIGVGLLLARAFLSLAPVGSVATARSRVLYLLKFMLIPLLAGTLIAWANRAPPLGHLTMPLFSGLAILPWVLAAAVLPPAPEPVTDRLHRGVDLPLIGVSIVVLLLFRLVLAQGVWV